MDKGRIADPETAIVNPVIAFFGLTRKMRLKNKEVYVMSDKPASNIGILRKSDEETIPGNCI